MIRDIILPVAIILIALGIIGLTITIVELRPRKPRHTNQDRISPQNSPTEKDRAA